MKVAVIIVTYNRLSLLKECINNALHQENVYTELVIIENKSSDGTYAYLKSLTEVRIHCVFENNNVGGAGGFHDGLKYAFEQTDCDWFLLIDDDAMIEKNYLSKIFKSLDPNISAYAGVVKTDSKIDVSHRLIMGKGPVLIDNYNKPSFDCDFATFCGLLVSRKLVDEIGYPRSDFFIWHDDTEFCYRMIGKTVIRTVTDATLDHKTMKLLAAKEIRDNWKWYYGFRNELVLYKTYNMKYRYYEKMLKLIAKAIFFRVKSIICFTNRKDYKYNSDIRIDSIKDMKKGKMGKSIKY